MLLNTVQFFVFFAVVISLHYAAPRPARRWILLAASYFSYMSWNWKFRGYTFSGTTKGLR